MFIYIRKKNSLRLIFTNTILFLITVSEIQSFKAITAPAVCYWHIRHVFNIADAKIVRSKFYPPDWRVEEGQMSKGIIKCGGMRDMTEELWEPSQVKGSQGGLAAQGR